MIALSTGTESSMKAMESDMIEEMVKDVNDGSICIKTIVGDEDSTMISKLRTNIDTNIGKTLDAYHVKEILRNHLYCEKITHNFNFKVIQYLKRCLYYIFAQIKSRCCKDKPRMCSCLLQYLC